MSDPAVTGRHSGPSLPDHRRGREVGRAALPRILQLQHLRPEHAGGLPARRHRVPRLVRGTGHHNNRLQDVQPVHVVAYVEQFGREIGI